MFLGPDGQGSLLQAAKVKRNEKIIKQARTLDRALIPKMMQNK